MISMKTAISIPNDIFDAVNQVAVEENISRSKIFADAARKYLEHRKKEKLLLALNEAYSQDESKEEKEVRKRSKKYYARKIVREKW
jgi:metal-responsive CopG/Arc/MetJ family transcriptional regulator